jgi:hypothetical protein
MFNCPQLGRKGRQEDAKFASKFAVVDVPIKIVRALGQVIIHYSLLIKKRLHFATSFL